MTETSAPPWELKRTEETRQVEEVLRKAGFATVDAYRYNSASIRVRVIDARFEGLPPEQRDALVEPILQQLPERTQVDIITLLTFSPSELRHGQKPARCLLMNLEFEDPSPSLL